MVQNWFVHTPVIFEKSKFDLENSSVGAEPSEPKYDILDYSMAQYSMNQGYDGR